MIENICFERHSLDLRSKQTKKKKTTGIMEVGYHGVFSDIFISFTTKQMTPSSMFTFC